MSEFSNVYEVVYSDDITGCSWCITDGDVKFQSNCSIHYFDIYIIPIQFNTNTSTGYNWPFKHIKNPQNDILNIKHIFALFIIK
jgi:hypothetical protein